MSLFQAFRLPTLCSLWGLIVDVNGSLQLLLGKSVFSELFNGKATAPAFLAHSRLRLAVKRNTVQ